MQQPGACGYNYAMDERTRGILLAKPERIIGFDDDLTARLRARVGSGNAALVEIAGRDSVAAGVLAASSYYDILIPTVVYTGTEYGNWEVVLENTRLLGDLLRDRAGVDVVEEPIFLGSPRWWHAAGGRFTDVLQERYGFSTSCVACHMYFHAARVPFAREIGAKAVVAGERLFHQDRRKLNQVGPALDSYSRVLGEAGLNLALPLKEMRDGNRVEELVGPWPESAKQLKCVLEANYRDSSGEFDVPEGSLVAYLEEFLEPVFSRVLLEFNDGGTPDYLAVVKDVLYQVKGPRVEGAADNP